MVGIIAWIIIVVAMAGAATRAIGLYSKSRGRGRPNGDEFRAEWYWIGMSFILALSALAILADTSHNEPLMWTAISAACAIACANATLWTSRRIRGRA